MIKFTCPHCNIKFEMCEGPKAAQMFIERHLSSHNTTGGTTKYIPITFPNEKTTLKLPDTKYWGDNVSIPADYTFSYVYC